MTHSFKVGENPPNKTSAIIPSKGECAQSPSHLPDFSNIPLYFILNFEYKDIVGTEINKDGDLIIQTEFGELIHKKPFGYQRINGKRTEVKASFKKTKGHNYSFDIRPYDRNLELIIDPAMLAYSTYLRQSQRLRRRDRRGR